MIATRSLPDAAPIRDRPPTRVDQGEGVLSPAETVLAQAQAGRVVIQDFCLLADSVEWQLGQRYLQQRGAQAFLSNTRPVPYVVNNDGSLSRHAAEVFFASVAAAEQAGTLESEILVLELGIGVGLFARYFLDTLRELGGRGHFTESMGMQLLMS